MLRAYIDVETTGFSRGAGARIVEVGAAIYDENWVEVASLSMLVNPGKEAIEHPDAHKAFAVNKIDPRDCSMDDWGECLMLAAQKDMGVGKWPKLSEACEHYDIPIPKDQHRALADARVAAQVHRRILA